MIHAEIDDCDTALEIGRRAFGARLAEDPAFRTEMTEFLLRKMDTYGFELAATYEVGESWRLHGSYSLLFEHAEITPPATFFLTEPGRTPRHMVYFQSSMDLTCNTNLDLMFRYVDRLTDQTGAPAYLVMDARWAWRPYERLEFSVVGRNLFDGHRREISRTDNSDIEREVYGYVSWEY